MKEHTLDKKLTILNETEKVYVKNYLSQVRMILCVCDENDDKYDRLSSLRRVIETEQSRWLDPKEGIDNSIFMWYTDCVRYPRNLSFYAFSFVTNDDMVNRRYEIVLKELEDTHKNMITRSELIIRDLYYEIMYELLKLQQKMIMKGIIPKDYIKIPKLHELPQKLKDDINDCLDISLSETKETIKLSFEDKLLISDFKEYNKLAEQIFDKYPFETPLPQLEKLIQRIERKYPNLIIDNYYSLILNKHPEIFHMWDEYDENGEPITKSGYIGFYDYRRMLETNDLSFSIVYRNDIAKKFLELSKWGIKNLHIALSIELIQDLDNPNWDEYYNNILKNIKFQDNNLTADHFSMSVSDTALKDILFDLKKYGWVAKETKDDDWIFRLTGRVPQNGKSPTEPIVFTGLNKCYYIVKNFIFKNYKKISGDDWDKAKTIFSVPGCNIDGLPNASKKPSGSNFIDDAIKNVKN